MDIEDKKILAAGKDAFRPFLYHPAKIQECEQRISLWFCSLF